MPANPLAPAPPVAPALPPIDPASAPVPPAPPSGLAFFVPHAASASTSSPNTNEVRCIR